jgi:hypothetical protein
MTPMLAAKLWARIERALVARGFLMDGRRLDEMRPELIRAVGRSAMVESAPAASAGVVEHALAVPAEHVTDDRSRPRHTVVRQDHRRVEMFGRVNDDHVFDPKLDAMLAKACSGTGYSGDDEVGYS